MFSFVGEVPRERKMLKGHLLRVIYHKLVNEDYHSTSTFHPNDLAGTFSDFEYFQGFRFPTD